MQNNSKIPQQSTQHKEEMFKQLAETIEKIGASDAKYTDTQKATDILEVLSTLLAFTIYNSCPNTETIRDASEATYFQIKQMALAYFYQQKQEKEGGSSQSPVFPIGNSPSPVSTLKV